MTPAACFALVVACVGVSHHEPRVVIQPGALVRCGHASPTGLCHGVYHPASNRVVLPSADLRSLPHEYVHSLIGDPHHTRPEWACQEVCRGPHGEAFSQ